MDVPGETPVRTGELCGQSTSDPDARRTPDGGQGPGLAQCPESCTVKAFPAGSCKCPCQGCSPGEPWASQEEAVSMPLLLRGEEGPQRRAPEPAAGAGPSQPWSWSPWVPTAETRQSRGLP